MSARHLALCGVCLVAGLAGGHGWGSWGSQEPTQGPQPTSRLVMASACPSLPVPVPKSPAHVLPPLVDIRQAIREELQAALAQHAPVPAEEQAPVEEDPAQVEQRQRVHEETRYRVQQALSRGTWTQEDSNNLRGVLHALPIPQQDELIGQLFTAIQEGRLRVEGGGPPL
jgi:hypothetical protein